MRGRDLNPRLGAVCEPALTVRLAAVTVGAPHVALGDLSSDRLQRAPLLNSFANIEALFLARPMIKLQDDQVRLAAIEAWALGEVFAEVGENGGARRAYSRAFTLSRTRGLA